MRLRRKQAGKCFPACFQKCREAMRASASRVRSVVLKAVRRKYPWPAVPKPEPGVPTTCACVSS